VSLHPCDEEIRRLKIEKEWQVLQEFIEKYSEMNKDILWNWKIKVSYNYNVRLIFRDDWNEEIRLFVQELLTKRLSKKLIKKLNEKGIYKICLFGLKRERGEVCNFPTRIFSIIDYKYFIDNGLPFGFPYSIRMSDKLSDELKEKWCILIDDIIRELKRRVK